MLIAGRYCLLEPVGSGGMGRVWLARDEMLDRDVAVKEFVPPDWMTDDEKTRLRDRTLREARSAGRLNHPHVVRVYDVVHAEGLPWIVMEYVPSRSLHQVINEDGPYSPVAAARIGLAVLDALSAAHRAGVLHRDVKPHNVLIGLDGRVVLTDFGLATFVDDGSVTGPGLVVGSPQYVSPERARDGASTVESDMWSLGATLYAAVEGRSPYARETAMSTLMSLATEPPDPPERAGLLGPVLLGLLRHDPEARLTASEVERRLRMVVAAAPGGGNVPSPRRARVTASAAAPVSVRTLPPPRVAEAPVSPAPAVPASSSLPASRSRPLALLIAVGLAGLVLIGAGGFLLSRADDMPVAGPSPSAAAPSFVTVGFSPAACSAPAPSSAPRLPQKGSALGVNGWRLLPGWSYFTDGSGFHIPVPDGWTYTKSGTMYCFRDTQGDRVLSLDTGRNPIGDPVKACRTEASRLVAAGALPGYHEISIEKRPLLNKAADWEYQYRGPDGAALHAQTRWFTNSGRGFALSWATREIDWSGDLAKINMILSTFYTDKPS
ncbi:protein kinase domain-containing protein [Actinoplanes sp. CA-142083]|uniref:serine/threonine-protein kinase n=1 Tax=Actinoplanes sp. CA-142083 TaxID=3239903 RepID=UPI003D8D00DA